MNKGRGKRVKSTTEPYRGFHIYQCNGRFWLVNDKLESPECIINGKRIFAGFLRRSDIREWIDREIESPHKDYVWVAGRVQPVLN